MKLQESGEMYLESILRLSLKSENVHSIDVAEYMGFSKPSVSRAMGLLKSGGYLTIDESGVINLTKEGIRVAAKIYERHLVLTRLFLDLGVSEETATEDACRMEHIISDETFQAIKKHMEKEHSEMLSDAEAAADREGVASILENLDCI